MSVRRRGFLQGSLSASALFLAAPAGLLMGEAAAAGIPVRSSASGTRRILLLRSAGDDAFARPALQMALRNGFSPVESLVLGERLVGSPGAVAKVLSEYRGARLIGIMDDCTHTLLEEALRDLGGSVLCRGHHRGLLHQAAASRHAFMTTGTTRGIGSTLARALTAQEAEFLVQEYSLFDDGLSDDEVEARDARSLPAAPWPRVLGRSYALMAAGLWTVGPVRAEQRRGTATEPPRSQAFVSLVAEV
jgi:hypothetical protein